MIDTSEAAWLLISFVEKIRVGMEKVLWKQLESNENDREEFNALSLFKNWIKDLTKEVLWCERALKKKFE